MMKEIKELGCVKEGGFFHFLSHLFKMDKKLYCMSYQMIHDIKKKGD